MNRYDRDILNAIASEPVINQRMLAEISGYSLGTVNRSVRSLISEGYINTDLSLTSRSLREIKENSPKNAVILAAGFGMRMVPINTEVSKGLLEVYGETLVERLIKQLHLVGITDISIVVGFLKERYEYLIDMYGVKLVVNPDYAHKNNLHSLNKVLDNLSDTYIIPCDIWFKDNPFRKCELYSWYMVSDRSDSESFIRVNRKKEAVLTKNGEKGNTAIGIAYISAGDSAVLKSRISEMAGSSKYNNVFWEEALFENGKMIIGARVIPDGDAVEINTFEQLRELDCDSNQLKSDVIQAICEGLSVPRNMITDLEVLKKGMTNRSFLFSASNKKYIMRIPGKGTEKLISRTEEAEVYRTLSGKGICDNVVYINAKSGYKITEYINNSRVCDPLDTEDLKKCMAKLREFHNMGLTVPHEFNIFRQIDFYESLWDGTSLVFKDYAVTKKNVFSLRPYIEAHTEKKVLSHIDAVPDNFLMTADGVRMIDWEYAAMHDPHVDIAMFCIYSYYDKEQTDQLIDIYFEGSCPDEIRLKIYCYISACGLLWSNWCEYKQQLGVEFGEYFLRQYRYAKEYYKISSELIERRDGKCSEPGEQ